MATSFYYNIFDKEVFHFYSIHWCKTLMNDQVKQLWLVEVEWSIKEVIFIFPFFFLLKSANPLHCLSSFAKLYNIFL
jgi:hypothetical protein